MDQLDDDTNPAWGANDFLHGVDVGTGKYLAGLFVPHAVAEKRTPPVPVAVTPVAVCVEEREPPLACEEGQLAAVVDSADVLNDLLPEPPEGVSGTYVAGLFVSNAAPEQRRAPPATAIPVDDGEVVYDAGSGAVDQATVARALMQLTQSFDLENIS